MKNELILAILVTSLALSAIFIFTLLKILSMRKRQEGLPLAFKELGAFGATLENIQRISQNLKDALKNVEGRLEERRRFDEVNQQIIKRIDHIIAGTKTKGIAGENIISEMLKQFPSDMIKRNFKIKGKEVEFGMVLSDGKIVPIDSKWTSSGSLEQLAHLDDPKERNNIINSIQREIKNRVQEVSLYIDPDVTTPLAITTIPDAAYSIIQDLHSQAYRKNVVLISYSMLLPYLLTLFHLHLQYSREYDIENLQQYLLDITRHTDEMNDILENKLIRASVMLSNATDEYRRIIASTKNSLIKISNRKPSS